MHIQSITTADKHSYNAFVASNNGSFLQSFEWGEWQEQNGKKVYRYTLGKANKQTLMSAQVLESALPLRQKYLYIPYGPIFKTSADKTFLQSAFNTLIEHLRQNHTQAVFIRIEPTEYPLEKIPGKKSLNIQPGSTILLDITKPGDELFSGMHSKTRYNIRLAQKHNVIVRSLTNEPEQTAAARMFFDTLHRRKLATPPVRYYKNLMNAFGVQSELEICTYGAFYQEKLVACALFADFGHTRTYVFGGSSVEHKNVMAPYLLHWTATQDARNMGLISYDWYGAEGAVSDGSGFARFKTGFGGTVVEYPGAHDIILHPLRHRAYSTARTLNRWIKHH